MFKRLVDLIEVLTAVATAVTVVMLYTATPAQPSGAQPDTAVGAELFAARCSACHGPSGGGGAGPPLAGEGALGRFNGPDEVATFVAAGVPGAMPGFETRLDPDEIDAVAHFVWSGLAGRP